MTITDRVVERARKRYGVKVLERHQWGSNSAGVYAARRARTRSGAFGHFRVKADTVAQHITVTRPTGNFALDCRIIERIGNDRFGSGVSYNFLVDMATGEVAVGQPLDSKGTHTVNDKHRAGFSYNQNLSARAIAVIGMPGTRLSDKAREAIARLLAAMMDEGAITVEFDYKPHSFFAWKDCPCDATRNAMPWIYRRARALRKAKPEPVKPAAPKPTRLDRIRDNLTDLVRKARDGGNEWRRKRLAKARNTLPGGKK